MRLPLSLLVLLFAALAEAAEPVEPPFTARQQAHWAFQPPVRPPLPAEGDSASSRIAASMSALPLSSRSGAEDANGSLADGRSAPRSTAPA